MSLTVFFAMCILGVDFLIYFFCKTLYTEKHRTRPRRLPAHYYSGEQQRFELYRAPARKARLSGGRVLSLPERSPKSDPRGHSVRSNFLEPMCYRRVS
ncbi:MAG TPA: hypothetical protein VNB49_05605 [Candidatus Dormibacteraeota bacterium]|nr:hypothetical protein [Candidatus Dormibacteraeota bacterium]